MTEESIFIPIAIGINSKTAPEILHIKRFYSDPDSPPVLMIHGSIENGKIFYSSSGKGLAPFLAKNGYDVFVVDLRGRGQSKPKINKHSKHGNAEILRDDIPAYINKIKELKGDVPQHWIGHSWGGILILAFLAKNFSSVKVASMVFFGTKRWLSVMSLKKIWTINILWGTLARLGISLRGYLPAKQYDFGSDNETKQTFYENNYWIKSKKWLDKKDKFDYSEALKKQVLPPTLYLTGKSDDILGDEPDVKYLMKETGKQDNYFKLLGKATGFKHDYGHNDILSHKDAVKDVYPMVFDFMRKGKLERG